MGFFDIESGPAAKFNDVGDSVSGTITEPYDIRQANDFATGKPKFDTADRPVMMAVITLSTGQKTADHPDGIAVLYAEKFGQRKAIADAVKASGAADLEVGGKLTVTYTGTQPSNKGNPLKMWSASYVRSGALTNDAPGSSNESGADDIVARARAAQEKAKADEDAMRAKSNGNGSKTADLDQIKKLAGMGFDAQSIHAAMPDYGVDAINAVLAMQS